LSNAKRAIDLKRAKYAIHYKQDGSVDWVGNVVERSHPHVVIDCADAVLLRCNKWSLSGSKKQVLIEDCCFFNSMVDAKNACDTANEYFA
jgi:hypothetical protein